MLRASGDARRARYPRAPIPTTSSIENGSASARVMGVLMAKHGHWMPIYWGDYLADTTHLSTFQHGAYLLLIAAYWCNGGPIPADEETLARICRTTKDKLARYGFPILAMFTAKDGLLYHQRIDFELSKSCQRISSAQAKANARWHPGDMQTTITTTKEESKKVVDIFGGKKKGGLEMTPENRLSLFHNWLAPLLGADGWKIIAEAMNPQSEFYAVAVETCKVTAKRNGKGWPHQWPK